MVRLYVMVEKSVIYRAEIAGSRTHPFLIFCRIELKFRFWVYKKRWHTSCKFQPEISGNKKVIAKKPLTNYYGMNGIFVTFECAPSERIITSFRLLSLYLKLLSNGLQQYWNNIEQSHIYIKMWLFYIIPILMMAIGRTF